MCLSEGCLTALPGVAVRFTVTILVCELQGEIITPNRNGGFPMKMYCACTQCAPNEQKCQAEIIDEKDDVL